MATEAEAATQRGMADFRERQAFYMANPGGVQVPADRPEWHGPGISDVPKGLGYQIGPDPVPVFVADSPALVPRPVPRPVIDMSPLPSLTGVSHGGWASLDRADAGPVFVSAAAPRRRSLWARMTGRG